MTKPLFEVQDLVRHFPAAQGMFRSSGGQMVRAVDGVSFTIARGETLGLVGESGCGKSTVARLATRIFDPDKGEVIFDGQHITSLRGKPLRQLRRNIQMVFQDPLASLNTRMTVGEIVEEPMIVHGIGDRTSRRARVKELLEMVGLADYHVDRRPTAFSGGQRQRISIARALAVEPALIVCDEPVSALDVSIQAQIVNLLQDLQQRLGLSYLFIAHDLAVVKHIADRIAVMYFGKIMEIAPATELFADPRHPYTRVLLNSMLHLDGAASETSETAETGEPPSPLDVPAGCRFHTRCPMASDICRRQEPSLAQWKPGHLTACHHAAELPAVAATRRAEAVTPTAVRLAAYAANSAGPSDQEER